LSTLALKKLIVFITQSEAELASGLKAVAAERARLSEREAGLEAQARRLEGEGEELGRERRAVAAVKLRMEQLAREAQERSNEMEEFGAVRLPVGLIWVLSFFLCGSSLVVRL